MVAILAFVVGLLVVVAAAAVVLRAGAVRHPAVPARLVPLRDAGRRLHPLLASLVVLVAGTVAMLALAFLLGKLAGALERPVDVPLFHWSRDHVVGWWHDVNAVVTQMGNRPIVKVVALVSAVLLAVLWRRRWWVPPAAIATAYLLERYGQQLLAVTVDRGHPPTTHGTYPSGGCARVVAVYGVILFLTLAVAPRLRQRVGGLAWSALAVLAYVEGYTRLYLLKHWATDVVGGWVFGALVLAVVVAATTTLLRPRREQPVSRLVPSDAAS